MAKHIQAGEGTEKLLIKTRSQLVSLKMDNQALLPRNVHAVRLVVRGARYAPHVKKVLGVLLLAIAHPEKTAPMIRLSNLKHTSSPIQMQMARRIPKTFLLAYQCMDAIFLQLIRDN